jgi:hypothetical protein
MHPVRSFVPKKLQPTVEKIGWILLHPKQGSAVMVRKGIGILSRRNADIVADVKGEGSSNGVS